MSSILNTPDAVPSAPATPGFFAQLDAARAALAGASDGREGFTRAPDGGDEALQAALRLWPTLYPQWAGRLEEYDSDRHGPLLGVSDEGSAGRSIADAAYGSAKARASASPGPMTVGIILDGERMGSAGEVPIGPGEYEEVVEAAFGRLLCTTNVGVRANARLSQFLPEFAVAGAGDPAWAEGVFARFQPFLQTPDARPRPLAVRLLVKPGFDAEAVRAAVRRLEEGRAAGRLGSPEVHRITLLLVFDDEIGDADAPELLRAIAVAAELGLRELAVDGELLEGARRRLSVQSLLNVLPLPLLNTLLGAASRGGTRLTYRYQTDAESAARTIWTGLHTARTYGLNAAKYGLVPLTLEEQEQVVRLVSRWTQGWTAIPAFYVDTPLVTEGEVFDDLRCPDAAMLWMERVSAAGARVVLIDSPDRVNPRRLLREEGAQNDRGVLTLQQVAQLHRRAGELGLRVLWSGGITPRQAHALGELGVFGIFTTSSTAQRIPVGPVLANDPQLAAEGEPTEVGVRRIHALIQGGFVAGRLRGADPELAAGVEAAGRRLLEVVAAGGDALPAVAALDDLLLRGWERHWSAARP